MPCKLPLPQLTIEAIQCCFCHSKRTYVARYGTCNTYHVVPPVAMPFPPGCPHGGKQPTLLSPSQWHSEDVGLNSILLGDECGSYLVGVVWKVHFVENLSGFVLNRFHFYKMGRVFPGTVPKKQKGQDHPLAMPPPFNDCL